MANWTSAVTPPTKAGRYRVKCGNSGDTFWARWNQRRKFWTNLFGEEIAFCGDRGVGDLWRKPGSAAMARKVLDKLSKAVGPKNILAADGAGDFFGTDED